ncbi:MAG: adenylate kinase [Planctomycetes bacterium]|nr:adenylate kinase [Planctomycetota bacterium]
MNYIFLGPPGVGKGTQAKRLAEHRSLPHISMGDLLRDAVANRTPVGVQAKSFMDGGKLVPDEVVCGVLVERLARPDAKAGFILDGFPRTVGQAESLTKTLAENKVTIDRVYDFQADRAALIERLSGRRFCTKCGHSFHLKALPPKQEGICDHCGATLVQRDDDKPATIANRLDVYTKQTAPVSDFYRAKGQLTVIDAMAAADQVFASLLKAL